MYSKTTTTRAQLIKRIITYLFMTASIIFLVVILMLFMLGYRFDSKGDIEQLAFLQFSSTPSGATVAVDGKVLGSRTPNKSSVPAGQHKVEMWRDGYEVWKKSVDVKSGTLTWLNYALLVPKKLTVQSVEKYPSIYLSLASSDGDLMLIQSSSDRPSFDLFELNSDNPKAKNLTIPAGIYTQPAAGVKQTFSIKKWDDDSRYVLVSHTYGSKSEWLVLDTEDVKSTKNITKSLDITVKDIKFIGTNGNQFYALVDNDIRKIDLSNGTLSGPIVSSVTSFDVYNESNVITWVGVGAKGGERTVGVYRIGDKDPSTIRRFNSSLKIPLRIATTHYFNEDYIAISEGNKTDVLKGSYPNTTSDNNNTMKTIASFTSSYNVEELSFSPSGEFVFIRSGVKYSTYDLEYQKLASATVTGKTSGTSLRWLDKNYLWSDRDGRLVIREFDGENSHAINTVVRGQDVALTNNGRYLYSFDRIAGSVHLQRVRMILP